MKRILSGVQPSGKLHLGNYFGAIRQHVQRQEHGDCFYFIADYHALTTLKEAEDKEAGVAAKTKGMVARPAPQILRDNVRDVALDYLALGLDPAKAHFFRQSDVPEVTELAWILSTCCGMGMFELAHSYKDKVAKGIKLSLGLFTYPALMAADILIYRSHVVPVGKDQEQHLEMTRDIAGSFNHAYGEIFPLPEAAYTEAAVVPGTDGQKMSKSYGNTIEIFAEGKALEKTVMGIVTDSAPAGEKLLPPDNLMGLYRLFVPSATAEEYAAGCVGYGDMKKKLFRQIDEYFAPFRDRRKQLARNPGVVEEALAAGAKRAREVAQVTMRLVREAVGMRERPV